MNGAEKAELTEATAIVSGWVAAAGRVSSARQGVLSAAAQADSQLRSRLVDVPHGKTVGWRVLVLGREDGQLLASLAAAERLPPLTKDDAATMSLFAEAIPRAIDRSRGAVGLGRLFRGSAAKQAADEAAQYVMRVHAEGNRKGISRHLTKLKNDTNSPTVAVHDALSPDVGLSRRLAPVSRKQALESATPFAQLPGVLRTLSNLAQLEAARRQSVVASGHEVRADETKALVASMPVERLKDATRDRLRVNALLDAGIRTVQQVLDSEARLQRLPGVGVKTADRMVGAAMALWQATYDDMPARLDMKRRSPAATTLLRDLAAWDAVRRTMADGSQLPDLAALRTLASAVGPRATHLVVFAMSGRSPGELIRQVMPVLERARRVALASGPGLAGDPWDDFLTRPADYYALLSELGFLAEDEAKAHGDLPDEIVEAVRALQLDTTFLTASLRGYQSFAARFLLVQKKVVIGDEMGLGKTVEALAALSHLRSKGEGHSLVVCPAAVVTNWVREVGNKTKLVAHRLHGPDRLSAARRWVRSGGVAVITYDTLGWLLDAMPSVPDLACVVVDEAHYIKNPDAKRTGRVRHFLENAPRAVLLTGTPLENRIEEFGNLVSYLRPDLVVDTDGLSARRFRQQVAPAYLRRNQEDVLTELPELVEMEDFAPFTDEDAHAYRRAVRDGNFMAMRQAALRRPDSGKAQRLVEIVREAEENDRRVIVFSYFRDALDMVARTLPGRVVGPLTGSVNANKRQAMVDEFSRGKGGAVLVAQIDAGGVGLNIQAASVVVICEPQLKPTTEWQAIARARRMGQLESVQVHRLLSEEGVDQRVREILAKKGALFDDFARVSATAESAPEAYDVSEAELAREVVEDERRRLFGTP
ncbi:ATP-dependent helicase [Geodermatophilaceae bacterium NBWT11]|nr:ATP-dependent helicase [Geodermatophilaceae bacterium NBWT11]